MKSPGVRDFLIVDATHVTPKFDGMRTHVTPKFDDITHVKPKLNYFSF